MRCFLIDKSALSLYHNIKEGCAWRVLGIDPGLATVGYGVIDCENGEFTLIDYGAIITPPDLKMPERLDIIFSEMLCLLDSFRPDNIAFEELFFAKNVKTAISVAHARGVLLASAYQYTKELYEYTPLQVKQAIVGYGRADKRQIQLMVKELLKLDHIPRPDDAADACAIAMTHAMSMKLGGTFKI